MKRRTKLILAAGYVLTFVFVLVATCFIQNYGVGGDSFETSAGLPVLYVNYQETQVNKMNAYVTPIDCGYLRESVSLLDSDGSITFQVISNGHTLVSLGYTLSDAANEYVTEEGTVQAVSSGESGAGGYRLTFKNPLVEDREYCLTLTLADSEDQVYYFYTRVISGQDYRLSDKLDFVWQFNQNTMDPDMSGTVGDYLETSGLNDNSTFADVDIYSSTSMVMWGGLEPAVTGTMATTIKAISADAATIQLRYKVQIYQDASDYTEYYVDEYYTIQWDNNVWHLRDFHRSLGEIPGTSGFEISSNMLRLGVVSPEETGLLAGETGDGYSAAFVMDGRLWYYDVGNNILTCVMSMDPDDSAACSGDYPYGIKALDIASDGTLYYIVYGYMTGGSHEGENGIAVYVFDPSKNTIQEQAFIPSDRGYEMLMMDVEKLAFMNDNHQLYLCLNDIVYRIDYMTGQAREVIEQLDIENYKLSGDGTILAMPSSPTAQDADQILVYYLDTGQTRTIQSEGKVMRLLGFFQNDIVYGTADPSRVYEDSVGTQIVPMDTLYIADSELNVVRQYSVEGQYIVNVRLNETTVDISLARAVEENGRTVYENMPGDYLVHNEKETEEDIYLTTVDDATMRSETYIQLPSSLSSEVLAGEAVVRDSGEIVFEIDGPAKPAQKYYLYTGDGLYQDYTSLVEAIEDCTQPTGLVVSESKQIVWEKSIRSSEYRTSFNSISQGDMITSVVSAICAYAEGKESVSVDSSMTLSQALAANLTEHTVVNLRGLSLDDVLYFVYADRPVIAQLRENEFVVIVGYNPYYLQVADPSTGEISDWNYETYSQVFEEEGNIFLSYY